MDTETKQKIYFDTTIPNYLFADTRPDRMEVTWRLWEKCKDGEYDIFVSDIFFEELERCPEPKLNKMDEQLRLIDFVRIKKTDEVKELAAEYIRRGAFVQKSSNDSLHIALAVTEGCDFVLSWNFHQTRAWTTSIIKEVNLFYRYKGIEILQPDVFLGRFK